MAVHATYIHPPPNILMTLGKTDESSTDIALRQIYADEHIQNRPADDDIWLNFFFEMALNFF